MFSQISVTLEGTSPSTLLANLTIPAAPTSVVIGGLVNEASYSIRAAAWTLVGLGPASQPVFHKMSAVAPSKIASPFVPSSKSGDHPLSEVERNESDSYGGVTQVVQETWFILLLGGILLAILCLLVAAIVVRRNLARKKALSTISKATAIDSGGAGSVRGRDAFWSRGWSNGGIKEVEVEAQATLLPHQSAQAPNNVVAPPEYAELLGHCINKDQDQQQQGQLSLSSFLPRRNLGGNQHPAAYATTTLVTHRSNGSSGNNSAQQQHQYGFNNPYAASAGTTFASDSSGYTTDEMGERHRRGYPSGKTKTGRQGSNNNVVKVLPNLGEMFPPPPSHPPPSMTVLEVHLKSQSFVTCHFNQFIFCH